MDIKKRELGKPKKPPSAYLSFVQAKAQERGQEPFKVCVISNPMNLLPFNEFFFIWTIFLYDLLISHQLQLFVIISCDSLCIYMTCLYC